MTRRRKRKTSTRSRRAERLSPPSRKIKRRKGSKRPPDNGKLNRRRRKILFDALALGMTRKAACALAGISTRVFSDYMQNGQDCTLTKYYHFRRRVKAIEAQRQLDALQVIALAGAGGYKTKKTKLKMGGKQGYEFEKTISTLAPQWHAAAWFLERKLKGDWGRDKVHDDKSAEEFAREVKEAADQLFNGIPLDQEEAA